MNNIKKLSIKKSGTIFLQLVIILTGMLVFFLLLWEPQVEGVNANATTISEIYFDDPFLALVYTGSIAFFVALYQAFKLLGYIGRNEIFREQSVKTLRNIKYCAIVIIGFVFVEEIFIMLNHGDDDAAGGVFMGILITFGSVVAATAAATFEKILQKAVDMKLENDLTV